MPKIRTGIVYRKNINHAASGPCRNEWSCSVECTGKWKRGIPFLLSAAILCAWAMPALAGEFASEFEEYEYYSNAPQKKQQDSAPAVTYRVRKGDTVCSIARAHNISMDALLDENGLSSGKIKAGMVLRIPAEKTVPRKHRPARQARTKEAFAPAEGDEKFLWPVSGVRKVSSDAEKGVSPLGVVISGKAGSRVVSALPGVVEKVGRMRGYGTFVVVRHSERLITVYASLGEATVRKGDAVRKGENVGRLPSDDGTLRFMVHRSGKPENPLKYLPKREG